MKEKHRLCIGCRSLCKAEDLIRIRINKGGLIFNPDFYLVGRSAYLCYNMECVLKAKKYKKLEKSFGNKVKITEAAWQELETVIETKQRELALVADKGEGN